MKHVLNLHTYDNKIGCTTIDDTNLMVVVRYTVSGDECCILIYNDGSSVLYDAAELAADGQTRLASFGPEDISIILPADMEWGDIVHEA